MNRNSSPSTPLTPPDNLTSADKVTNNSSPLQENGELFRPEDEYTAEEQAIIDQAKVNSTYLKAPNGKDTKLTPKQWAQARTQAFKNWFGDWELVFKKDFLLNGSPVKSLTGNEFARVANKNLTDQVEEYFESIGNIAHSPLYGDVILDRDGADDSLAHGMGRTKAIAYAAVKEVIEAGVLIDYHNNHKGRGYDSAVISAPIEIGGERFVCNVVIHKNHVNNKFYLHEVTQQKNLLDEVFLANLAQKPTSSGDLAKLLQNIVTANNFASKVVDENGEPLVVYHGTKAEFAIFDASHNHKANKCFF